VAADGPSQQRQLLQERPDPGLKFRIIRGCGPEHADPTHTLTLLRACHQRPRGYTAAEKCDEFPPPHRAYPKPNDHHPILAPCIAAKSGHSRPVRVIRVDLASGASPLVSRFQTYQAGCLSDVVPTTFLIQFAERVLRNIGSGLPRQSGLMLRVRMSLPHFSVS